MPCRDYESDSWNNGSYEEISRLKDQANRLARIACKAMTALEEDGRADLLLLKDDEVRKWWTAHQEADRKEKARVAEKERRERVKAEALARLSQEEKELLGLVPKAATKKKPAKTVLTKVAWPDDEVETHTIDGETFNTWLKK